MSATQRVIIQYALRELYCASAREGPCRPLADVLRDVRLVLVAQQIVGETHGGEVDFLQQPESVRAVSGTRQDSWSHAVLTQGGGRSG